MELITKECCPLCQSENISLFQQGSFNPKDLTPADFKITDNAYGSTWNFFKCKQCTFVFSNPGLTDKTIVKFYEHLEDIEYSEEASGRSKNFKTLLKRLKKLDPQGNTLLDVGAASGIFLNIAKDAGYDVTGIEPSTALAKEAKDRFGLDLFVGTVEQYQSDKIFDVITLLDIIEHLVDPDAFMSRISRLLSENGTLIIVTPDIDSLSTKIFKRKWWHFRIAHINFFNLKSLAFLLEKHGLTIVKKKRYTWNFSFYYILTRLFPIFKNRKTLQKVLKKINLKIQLFDSWEIYAQRKGKQTDE